MTVFAGMNAREVQVADVFEVLSQEHDELRQLLAALHIGPTAQTGATDNQLVTRKKLTDQLVSAECRHEALEDQFFWPTVRTQAGEPARLAHQAIAQEREIARTLAALEQLDTGASEFEPLLTEAISSGLEHLDFEEQEVWPVLRQAFSPTQASELGSEIARGKAVRA